MATCPAIRNPVAVSACSVHAAGSESGRGLDLNDVNIHVPSRGRTDRIQPRIATPPPKPPESQEVFLIALRSCHEELLQRLDTWMDTCSDRIMAALVKMPSAASPPKERGLEPQLSAAKWADVSASLVPRAPDGTISNASSDLFSVAQQYTAHGSTNRVSDTELERVSEKTEITSQLSMPSSTQVVGRASKGPDMILPYKKERTSALRETFSHRFSEIERQRKAFAWHFSRAERQNRSFSSNLVSIASSSSFLEPVHWRIRHCVASSCFAWFTMVMIMTHLSFIGVQLDHVTSANYYVFFYVNIGYTGWFVFEILLRIASDGPSYMCHKENIFDAAVAIAALVDAVHNNTDHFSQWRMVNILRVARGARVFEELSMTRSLTQLFRSFRVMASSAFGTKTLRSLMSGLLLHCMMIYLFALVFTAAAADPENSIKLSTEDLRKLDQFYGSVSLSCLCLFQATTSGLDWSEAVQPLGEISVWYPLLWVAFIAFVYFSVMNVITGHFCQHAIHMAQRDKDHIIQEHIQLKDRYIRQLEALFCEIDTSKAGSLTLGDFEESLNESRIKSFFESLEIETTDAWTIFKLLDSRGTQAVTMREFVDGCLRLRGGARSVDIAKLQYDIEWLTRNLGHLFDLADNRGAAVCPVRSSLEGVTNMSSCLNKDIKPASATNGLKVPS